MDQPTSTVVVAETADNREAVEAVVVVLCLARAGAAAMAEPGSVTLRVIDEAARCLAHPLVCVASTRSIRWTEGHAV